MSTYGLIIEGGLALLLLLTAGYCWRLDQKLSALRKGNDGMIAAAKELAETISQAEATIRGMRSTADETGRQLQSRIDEARALANSLNRSGGGRRGY